MSHRAFPISSQQHSVQSNRFDQLMCFFQGFSGHLPASTSVMSSEFINPAISQQLVHQNRCNLPTSQQQAINSIAQNQHQFSSSETLPTSVTIENAPQAQLGMFFVIFAVTSIIM